MLQAFFWMNDRIWERKALFKDFSWNLEKETQVIFEGKKTNKQQNLRPLIFSSCNVHTVSHLWFVHNYVTLFVQDSTCFKTRFQTEVLIVTFTLFIQTRLHVNLPHSASRTQVGPVVWACVWRTRPGSCNAAGPPQPPPSCSHQMSICTNYKWVSVTRWEGRPG